MALRDGARAGGVRSDRLEVHDLRRHSGDALTARDRIETMRSSHVQQVAIRIVEGDEACDFCCVRSCHLEHRTREHVPLFGSELLKVHVGGPAISNALLKA